MCIRDRHNAGVTVAVINLRSERPGKKYIYTDGLQIEARNINGYLSDSPNIFMKRQMRALSSQLPTMALGSVPKDDGALVLERAERDELREASVDAESFVKRFMGSVELINDRDRYCLWITKDRAEEAARIPDIGKRLAHVREFRAKSTSANTSALADDPYRFWHIAFRDTESIIVPRVSSERRDYIPMGYLGPETVISDAAYAVYDAEPWVFALLTSAMHMVWTRAVGGRMKTDYRYSNTIVYNNFPVPPLSEPVRELLTGAALRVLDVREYHCEKTLAELYDPDKMPADLRAAHAEVDALVDGLYSKRGYESDEQRLSDLFAMYESMTATQAASGSRKR